MKKISYKNKHYKKKRTLKDELPSVPQSGDGNYANSIGIGRGYFMPGEQAIPAPDSDDPVFLKKKHKGNKPTDYTKMQEFFIEIADQMDAEGKHSLASFADFLIMKISQQKSVDYQVLLRDLIVKISKSDILNKNNLIISVGKIYNDKFLNFYDNYSIEEAHREAYQDAFSFAENSMENK